MYIHIIYKYILLMYDHCVEFARVINIRSVNCSFRKALIPLLTKKKLNAGIQIWPQFLIHSFNFSEISIQEFLLCYGYCCHYMQPFVCMSVLLFGKEVLFKIKFMGYLCWVPFLIVFISNIREKKAKKSFIFPLGYLLEWLKYSSSLSRE